MLIKIVNDTVEVRRDDAVLIKTITYIKDNFGKHTKTQWLFTLEWFYSIPKEDAEAVIFVLEQTYGSEYFKEEK